MMNWSGRELSDGFVASVKLRATGNDVFVQPQQPRAVNARFPEPPRTFESFPVSYSVANALLPLAELMVSRAASSQGSASTFSHSSPPPQQTAKTPSEHEEGPRKRVRVKTERRREQCRANQARYRNKQRLLRNDLEGTVTRLREEVADLETRRRKLASTTYARLTPWTIAVEYFRLFRHGASILPSRKPVTQRDSDSSSRWELMTQTEAGKEQLNFLRSAIVEDVQLVGTHGVEELANRWVFWTQCFDDLEFRLVRIETPKTSALTIATTLRVFATISDSTVRRLFPHLLSRGSASSAGQSNDADLAWKLCGQPFDMKCVISFECDAASGRVCRVDTQLDIVPAMLKVLGSLADVARVLDGSGLTTEGLVLPQQ